ncbi:MAG: hypothetical protein HYZ53_25600 [Planctomycetes bacterium]|nr:hypothetical protein [Planctomycetota bacterium]
MPEEGKVPLPSPVLFDCGMCGQEITAKEARPAWSVECEVCGTEVLVPKRSKAPRAPRTRPCPACRAEVDAAARNCPACGAKLPRRLRGAIGCGALGAVALAIGVAWPPVLVAAVPMAAGCFALAFLLGRAALKRPPRAGGGAGGT